MTMTCSEVFAQPLASERVHAPLVQPKASVASSELAVKYSEYDFQIMTAILSQAEEEARSDAARGLGNKDITLLRLLKAYDVVLRKNSIVPEEDTHYYRFLLKLSLDPYPNWWDKLQAEQLAALGRQSPMCTPAVVSRSPRAAFHSASPPLRRSCSPPALQHTSKRHQHFSPPRGRGARSVSPTQSYSTQPVHSTTSLPARRAFDDLYSAGSPAGTTYITAALNVTPAQSQVPLPELIPSRPLSPGFWGSYAGPLSLAPEDEQAYSLMAFTAEAFRVWRRHTVLLRGSRAARDLAVKKWLKATGFWERTATSRMFITWRDGPARKLSRALNCWIQGALASAFCAWRGFIVQKSDLVVSALQRYCSRSLRGSFVQWRKCLSAAEHARATARAHAAMVRRRRALRAWQAVAFRSAELGLTAAGLAELAADRAARACWSRWRLRYKAVCKQRASMLRALAHIHRKSLLHAYETWKQNATGLKWERLGIQQALSFWCGRTTQAVFEAWREHAACKSRTKSKHARCVAHLANLVLARAYRTWFENVAAIAGEREVVRQAVQRLTGGLLLRAFEAWKARARSLGSARFTAEKCLNRILQHTLAQAFQGWLHTTLLMLELRAKLDQIVELPRQRAFDFAWTRWRGAYAKQKKLASLHLPIVHLFASRTLSTWRVATAMVKVRRDKLRTTMLHLLNRRMHLAFCEWAAYTEHRKRGNDKRSRAAAFFLKSAMVKAWDSWLLLLEQRAANRAKAQPFLNRLLRREVTQAFETWRAHTQAAIHERSQLRRAVGHVLGSTLLKAFSGWRRACAHLTAKKAKMTRAMGFLTKAQLAKGFTAWVERAGDLRAKRSKLARAAGCFRNTRLAAAFHTWRDRAQALHRKQHLAAQALGHLRSRALACAFVGWLEGVVRKKENRRMAQRVLGHFIHRQTAAAFAAWLEFCAGRSAKRVNMQRAAATFRCLHVAKAWRRWADFVAERQHLRNFGLRALAHWRQRALADAWNEWRDNVRLTKKLRAVLYRVSHVKLCSAWTTWRSSVLESKNEKQTLARVFAHYRQRVLAKAYNEWRANVRDQVQHSHLTRRALAHFTNNAQLRALEAWHEAVELANEKRELLRLAVAHWQKQSLVAALAAWVDYVVEKRERQVKMQVVATKLTKGVMARAWATWRFWVHEARLAKRAGAAFAKATLSKAWRTWRVSIAERHCLEARAYGMIARMRNRSVAAGWSSWRAFVARKRARKVQLRRALAWWTNGALKGVWDTWRAVLRDKAAQEHKMRHALQFWQRQSLAAAFNALRSNRAQALAFDHYLANVARRALTFWARFTEYKAGLHAQMEKGLKRWMHGTLHRAFETWREGVEAQKDLKVKQAHALAFWTGNTLSLAFTRWRDGAVRQPKALGHWMNRLLAGSWLRWVELLEARLERNQAARRLLVRVVSRHLAAGFDAFLENVAYMRSLRRAVRHFQGDCLTRAFQGWVYRLSDRTEKRAKLRRAALHFTNAALVTAMRQWKESVQVGRGELKALAYFRNATLGAAWNAWLDFHAERLEERQKVLRALNMFCGNSKAKAFYRWTQYATRRAQCQQLAAAHVAKLLKRELTEAWNQWSATVMEARSEKTGLLKAANFLRNRGIARCFYPWRDHAQRSVLCNRKATSFLQRLLFGSKATAFCAWREEVQVACQERSAAERAALTFRNVLKRKAWNSWQDCVALQRAKHAKMATALTFMSQRTLVGAWNAWLCHVDDRRAFHRAVAHLRRSYLWRAFGAFYEHWRLRKLGRRGLTHLLKRHLARAWTAWVDMCNDWLETRDRAQALQYRVIQRLTHGLLASAFASLKMWAQRNAGLRMILFRVRHRAAAIAFEAWAGYTIRMAAAETLLTRVLLRYQSSAFVWWRYVAQDAAYQRTLVAAMAHHLRTHAPLREAAERTLRTWKLGAIIPAAFRTWHENHRLAQKLEHKAEHAALFALQTRERRAWGAFRENVAEAKKRRKAVRFWAGTALELRFYEWRDATRDARLHAHKLQRAAGHFFGVSCRRALQCWREYMTYRHERAALYAISADYMRGLVLCRTFDTWRAVAAFLGNMRLSIHRLQHSHALARLRGCLLAWADYVFWQKRLHAGNFAALQFYFARAVADVFAAWRKTAARCRRNDGVLRHAAARLQSRALTAAFHTWREHAAALGQARWQATALLTRILKRTMFLAFAAWFEVAQHQNARKAAARRALAHLTQRQVSSAWMAWVDFVDEQREKHHRSRTALAHWCGSALHRAFWSWQAFMQEQHTVQECKHTALLHWQNRQLWAAWEPWKAAWLEAVEKRESALRLLRRRFKRDLQTFFQEWALYTFRLREADVLYQRAVVRLTNRLLSDAFEMWLDSALEGRALAWFRNASAFKAFHTWREHVRVQKIVKSVVMGDRVVLKYYWAAWRANVTEQVATRFKTHRAALKFFASAAQKAWTMWRDEVRRNKKLRGALLQRDEKCKKHALQAWREASLVAKFLKGRQDGLAGRAAVTRVSTILAFWRSLTRSLRFYHRLQKRRVVRTWRTWVDDKHAMREKLVRVVAMLRFGTYARAFQAWRDHTADMYLKRLVFVRKQRALRNAVLVGNQIARRRRRELLVVTFEAWKLKAGMFKRIADVIRQRTQTTMRACWGLWIDAVLDAACERANTAKALLLNSSWLCRRAFDTWVANANALIEDHETKMAAALEHLFARSASYVFMRWRTFVQFARRRRRVLQKAIGVIAGCETKERKRRCFLAWLEFVEARQRAENLGEMACNHAERRKLSTVFSTWAMYVRALGHELQDDSPFLSPRRGESDCRIVTRLAYLSGSISPVEARGYCKASDRPASASGEDATEDGSEDCPPTHSARVAHERRRALQPFVQLHDRNIKRSATARTYASMTLRAPVEMSWGAYDDELDDLGQRVGALADGFRRQVLSSRSPSPDIASQR